jgi:intracellular sulfur oxidation DsrE/DsrF family protein
MSTERNRRVSRRGVIKIAGAVVAGGAGAAAVAGEPKRLSAAELRPGDPLYHFDQYEAIVNRDVTVRQLFQWPNIANHELYANAVNALNAFQFAYQVPADQIQIVVQAYASSTVATYDDYLWNKYSLGQALQLQDAQGNPTTVNPFLHSKLSVDQSASPPSDQNDPYYFDFSIEGLQRRGVLFLACNNSLRGDANSAFRSGRNPDNLSADAIVTEFQSHLIPRALLVPAGAAELVRLQDKGYRVVVNS